MRGIIARSTQRPPAAQAFYWRWCSDRGQVGVNVSGLYGGNNRPRRLMSPFVEAAVVEAMKRKKKK